MVNTRSQSMDEATKKFITETIAAVMQTAMADVQKSIDASVQSSLCGVHNSIEGLNQSLKGVYVQQNFIASELQRNVSDATSSGAKSIGTRVSRFAKVEFPKFNGDYVMGWVYRCRQFFSIEEIEDSHKVKLASIHLYDRALAWHQQYTRNHGDCLDWNRYLEAIQQRFGASYEDPLAELKNLKQEGTVQEYQDSFDLILCKIDLTDAQAVSLYLVGLKPEIESVVRMFKPKTIMDAHCLAKLQESTSLAGKKAIRTTSFNSRMSTQGSTNFSSGRNSSLLPTPDLNQTANSKLKSIVPSVQPRKQLSQKEYEEKRAKNISLIYSS